MKCGTKSAQKRFCWVVLFFFWSPVATKTTHLYLCFMLHGVAGSTVKGPDLKVVTTGVLCRQRDQLQFTGQLLVLRQPQLRLGWTDSDRRDT